MNLREFETYIHSLDVTGLRMIDHIQTHHTWSPSYRDFNGHNHFDKLTSMEADHIARGFGQIAQHYTTFPDGTIAACRPLTLIPTCIHDHNTGGICIENLGNFDLHGDVMTDIQGDTIAALNALLINKFKLTIDTDHIVYHHWFKQSNGVRDNAMGKADLADHKTCPGTNFFGGNTVAIAENNFLPAIKKALEGYQQQAPPVATPTSKEGTVNADVLNIRNGPDTSYTVMETLTRGTKVTVLEERNGWYRISDNLWANAAYVILS